MGPYFAESLDENSCLLRCTVYLGQKYFVCVFSFQIRGELLQENKAVAQLRKTVKR